MDAKRTPAERALLAASRKALKVLRASRSAIFEGHAERVPAKSGLGTVKTVTDAPALAWIEEHDVAIQALRSAISKATGRQS